MTRPPPRSCSATRRSTTAPSTYSPRSPPWAQHSWVPRWATRSATSPPRARSSRSRSSTRSPTRPESRPSTEDLVAALAQPTDDPVGVLGAAGLQLHQHLDLVEVQGRRVALVGHLDDVRPDLGELGEQGRQPA